MKKVLFALLVTGMMFAIVACSGSSDIASLPPIPETTTDILSTDYNETSTPSYDLSAIEGTLNYYLANSDRELRLASPEDAQTTLKPTENTYEIPEWVSEEISSTISRSDWLSEEDRYRFYDLWTWLAEREANEWQRVLMFRHANTRREEIQHWSRHQFEQRILPGLVSHYEQQILRAINADDIYTLEDIFDHFWSAWATDVIVSDMYVGEKISAVEELELYMPYCCGDCGVRLSWLVLQLYGMCPLQQIIGGTMAELADGTNVVILKMNQTGWLNLSTYIGVVYIDDGFGLQVFTLEKGAETYFFCAVHVDSRENFGEIENDLDAFINAISIFVTGQVIS